MKIAKWNEPEYTHFFFLLLPGRPSFRVCRSSRIGCGRTGPGCGRPGPGCGRNGLGGGPNADLSCERKIMLELQEKKVVIKNQTLNLETWVFNNRYKMYSECVLIVKGLVICILLLSHSLPFPCQLDKHSDCKPKRNIFLSDRMRCFRSILICINKWCIAQRIDILTSDFILFLVTFLFIRTSCTLLAELQISQQKYYK